MQSGLLDEFDVRLLTALQENSRLTHQELSLRVHLSPSQCQRRLKKLEESGIVTGYAAILSREKLHFDVLALVNVSLNKHSGKASTSFQQAMVENKQVLECWSSSGEADYVLKVVTANLKEFSAFLSDFLLQQAVVSEVRANILLQDYKVSTALPLE